MDDYSKLRPRPLKRLFKKSEPIQRTSALPPPIPPNRPQLPDVHARREGAGKPKKAAMNRTIYIPITASMEEGKNRTQPTSSILPPTWSPPGRPMNPALYKLQYEEPRWRSLPATPAKAAATSAAAAPPASEFSYPGSKTGSPQPPARNPAVRIEDLPLFSGGIGGRPMHRFPDEDFYPPTSTASPRYYPAAENAHRSGERADIRTTVIGANNRSAHAPLYTLYSEISNNSRRVDQSPNGNALATPTIGSSSVTSSGGGVGLLTSDGSDDEAKTDTDTEQLPTVTDITMKNRTSTITASELAPQADVSKQDNTQSSGVGATNPDKDYDNQTGSGLHTWRGGPDRPWSRDSDSVISAEPMRLFRVDTQESSFTGELNFLGTGVRSVDAEN